MSARIDPEHRSALLTIRISPILRERAHREAAKRGDTLSNVLRELIVNWMAEKKSQRRRER